MTYPVAVLIPRPRRSMRSIDPTLVTKCLCISMNRARRKEPSKRNRGRVQRFDVADVRPGATWARVSRALFFCTSMRRQFEYVVEFLFRQAGEVLLVDPLLP